jgi:tetratricopeptide (TPR) repeat protein
MLEHYNRATRLLEANKGQKALVYFKKCESAFQHSGTMLFKELYLNMGNAYRLAGDDRKAIECYVKANSPDLPFLNGRRVESYSLAENNIGLMHYRYGRDALAIQHYNQCLQADPLHYDAVWNRGNATLRMGFDRGEIDWPSAWADYEYRFRRNSNPIDLKYTLRWDGVSHVHEICVLAEQGIGDKLMFGRYIHLLEAFCDKVTVMCDPSLDIFFSRWECVRVPSGYGVPICSLAQIFGISSAPATWLAHLRKPKHVPLEGVGIVWAGSATHANNANRSMSAGYFRGLSNLATLHNLSLNNTHPSYIRNHKITDWDQTIRLVSQLDLVITVDTSIVHLCGSLGVECWMIQPLLETDFRWGNSGSTTPWYPSVRIIRNLGSWEKTMDHVVELYRQRVLEAPMIAVYKELLTQEKIVLVKPLAPWATLTEVQESVIHVDHIT